MSQERSADRRKHHVIYKTTCLVTGRWYIGMHSTDNLNDGYIGSGKRLWQSIKKHGAEQHKCEILEHRSSRRELADRESQLVTEEVIKNDPMCMNLVSGGFGSWDAANRQYTPEARKRCGEAGTKRIRELCKQDKHYCTRKITPAGRKLASEKISAHHRKRDPELQRKFVLAGGRAASEKMPAFWKAYYEAGGKASMQDKRWVSNIDGALLVEASEVQGYLDRGYLPGKLFKAQSEPRGSKKAARLEAYKKLQPVCRNVKCQAELTFEQHDKGMTSCSKACSNATRKSVRSSAD